MNESLFSWDCGVDHYLLDDLYWWIKDGGFCFLNFLFFCLRNLIRFSFFFNYLLGFGLFFVFINFLLFLFKLWFFFIIWFALWEWFIVDIGLIEVILFVFMMFLTILNYSLLLYVTLLVVQRSVKEVKHFFDRLWAWEFNWKSCHILLIIFHHESLTYFLRIFNLHLTLLRMFFINFFLRFLIVLMVLLIFLFDRIFITATIFHLLPILFFINFVHFLEASFTILLGFLWHVLPFIGCQFVHFFQVDIRTFLEYAFQIVNEKECIRAFGSFPFFSRDAKSFLTFPIHFLPDLILKFHPFLPLFNELILQLGVLGPIILNFLHTISANLCKAFKGIGESISKLFNLNKIISTNWSWSSKSCECIWSIIPKNGSSLSYDKIWEGIVWTLS